MDPYFLFQPSKTYDVPSAVVTLRKIAIGDLTGDGRPEILVAGSAAVLGILIKQSQ